MASVEAINTNTGAQALPGGGAAPQPQPSAAGVAAGAAGVPAGFSKTASLYVGDLAPDISETQLFEVFNAVAPVANIRVCRNAMTRESLGYAYVNFHTAADAEKTMNELNYTPVKGRPCRIMWSQRDPTLRRSNVGNLCVKHLAPEVTSRELFDTFRSFGNILSCKVATDGKGESKGYGFVHFETDEAAKNAIKGVDGVELDGKFIVVTPYLPKQQRNALDNWTNVYVKNLPKSYGIKQLQELFGSFGETLSCIVSTEPDGSSRGFGFVCYKEHDAARQAADALNGRDVESLPNVKKEEVPPAGEGKPAVKLYVGRAQKKSERERQKKEKADTMRRERMQRFANCNLYVRNLDESVDDEALRKEFSAFGTIASSRIERTPDGRSKLFGYVCFSSPDEAAKAVSGMNHKILQGKPLYVALWQPKEQRAQQLSGAVASRSGYRGGVPAGAAPMGTLPGGVNPMALLAAASNPLLAQALAMANPALAALGRGGASSPEQMQQYQAFIQQQQALAAQLASNPAYLQALMAQLSGGAARGMPMNAAAAAAGGRNIPNGAGRGMPGAAGGFPAFPGVFFNMANGGMSPQAALQAAAAAAAANGGMQGQQQRVGGGRRGAQGPGAPGAAPPSAPGGQRVAAGPGSARPVAGMPAAGAPRPGPTGVPPGGGPAGPQAARPAATQGAPGAGPRGPQAAAAANMQYRANARNMPGEGGPGGVPGMQMMPAMMGPQGGMVAANGPVDPALAAAAAAQAQAVAAQGRPVQDFASYLASLSHEQRRHAIGERLYTMITPQQPQLGGKITGMLLEGMDVSELLHLLESPADLRSRIEEALGVLEDHNKQHQPTA